MASNEKPQVDVPSDQPPSYQLELDDIELGYGDEAVSGEVVEVHFVGVSWATGDHSLTCLIQLPKDYSGRQLPV